MTSVSIRPLYNENVFHSLSIEGTGSYDGTSKKYFGENIPLRYAEKSGYQFLKFETDPELPITESTSGGTKSYSIIMPDNDVSVKAVYEDSSIERYSLTIVGADNLNGGNTGRYAVGEKITIEFSKPGYWPNVTFPVNVEFSLVWDTNTDIHSYTFSMPAKDITITIEWVIIVSIEYGGKFIDSTIYDETRKDTTVGAVHGIAANPPDPANYEMDFDHWEIIRGSGSFEDDRSPVTNLLVNESEGGGNLWIRAVYRRSKYRVSGDRYLDFRGSVQGHGHYAPGEIVTLTAVPNEGNRFRTWVQSVDDPNDPNQHVNLDWTANPTSFIMPECDAYIAASFESM